MKNVTIGFSKSKKNCAIGSALIRWYLQTPYSHVYIKFEAKSLNRWLVYEAVGAGVRFIGMNQWNEEHEEVAHFDIEISDENYIKLMQFCVDNSGGRYGYLQNLGVLWANLFGLKKNPITDGENCSEVIGDILKLEGYDIEKDSNLLTPKDIYSILND